MGLCAMDKLFLLLLFLAGEAVHLFASVEVVAERDEARSFHGASE